MSKAFLAGVCWRIQNGRITQRLLCGLLNKMDRGRAPMALQPPRKRAAGRRRDGGAAAGAFHSLKGRSSFSLLRPADHPATPLLPPTYTTQKARASNLYLFHVLYLLTYLHGPEGHP